MDLLFKSKSARVLIVDNSSARRQLISDGVKNLGFKSVTTIGSFSECLSYLETELAHWIISPLRAGSEVNALHLLEIFTKYPKFRQTRVSLLLAEAEKSVVPLAFTMGAISWHDAAYIKEDLYNSLLRFMKLFESRKWDPVKTAAAFLKAYLSGLGDFEELERFCRNLLELYPGDTDEMYSLALALKERGRLSEALKCTDMLCALSSPVPEPVSKLKTWIETHLSATSEHEEELELKPTGVGSCLLVASNESAGSRYQEFLRELQINDIVKFINGDDAAQWIEANSEPDLIILDWTASGTMTPILIQKMRMKGYSTAPILVVGKGFQSTEANLLQELGVSYIISPTAKKNTFLRSIVSTVQQSRRPTEKASFEQKIRLLLQEGNRLEAERLRVEYHKNPGISNEDKEAIDAELAYHDGDYHKGIQLCFSAMKRNKSLNLINLLGRCFMKVGSFSAAAQCFTEADELAPDNIQRLCLLAEAKINLDETQEARDSIERAKELDDSSEDVKRADCQIALSMKEVQRAREIMLQIPMLKDFIAMVNNRAVVLIRSGSFEKGIDLYWSTIKAIPKEWKDIDMAVRYNLALAYARYGDLEESLDVLKDFDKNTTERIDMKAKVLESRIKMALESGSELKFSDEGGDGVSSEGHADRSGETGSEDGDVNMFRFTREELDQIVKIRKGDLCCYLVYEPSDDKLKDTENLLDDKPEFRIRDGIERNEVALRFAR